MGKPKHKPAIELHPPAPPRSRFVANGPAELAHLDTDQQVPRVLTRRGGRAVAKRSIYFTIETDTALARFCGNSKVVSTVVDQAVAAWLKRNGRGAAP